MIRQSNYTNEWLIFDIADHLNIDKEELLNGKQMQIKMIKEITKNSLKRGNAL